MDRIIIDTYRLGENSRGRNPNSREANVDREELPLKESMRKKWKMNWSGKEPGDRLSPLSRWLGKQVGRKWDAIYSEICNIFDKRSVSQSHLIDHVERMVEKDVEYIDGIPYNKIAHYGNQFPIRKDVFYVCPNTGIFKKGEKDKKRENIKLTDIDGIHFKNGRSIEKINGIWYELFLKKNEKYFSYLPWATQRDRYGFITYRATGEYAMYVTEKRQINKKQIKIVEKYVEDCLKYINKLNGKNRWNFIDRFNYKGLFIMAWEELKF
jgi:hypothetical protein